MAEGTTQSTNEALEATDRSLRRLLRHLKEANPTPNEELDTLMRRARRQLRANADLLEDQPESENRR